MTDVRGDPAVLNDVGNRCLTAGRDLTGAGTGMSEQGTFDRASLGQAAVGTTIDADYADAVAEAAGLVSNLSLVLEEDGYHLQRASRDIDTVMNRCEPSGSAAPPAGPHPVPQ